MELFTDSNYLRNGITKWVHGWQRNGWRTASKQPVKNQDLWKALITAVDRHKSTGGGPKDTMPATNSTARRQPGHGRSATGDGQGSG
ncbi:MAG: RNase H family protein [Caldilineaceae bacterium]